MPLTKTDLKKAFQENNRILLKQTRTELQDALKKNNKMVFTQLAEFLEEHVIEPLFGLKKDMIIVKKDVHDLKDNVEGLNRKVDALFLRGDRQVEKMDDHEKRITRLEHSSALAV